MSSVLTVEKLHLIEHAGVAGALFKKCNSVPAKICGSGFFSVLLKVPTTRRQCCNQPSAFLGYGHSDGKKQISAHLIYRLLYLVFISTL